MTDLEKPCRSSSGRHEFTPAGRWEYRNTVTGEDRSARLVRCVACGRLDTPDEAPRG